MWSRLHVRWDNLPHVTSPTWDPPPSCKQALSQSVLGFCIPIVLGFRIHWAALFHMQNSPGFRNPNSLTWGDTELEVFWFAETQANPFYETQRKNRLLLSRVRVLQITVCCKWVHADTGRSFFSALKMVFFVLLLTGPTGSIHRRNFLASTYMAYMFDGKPLNQPQIRLSVRSWAPGLRKFSVITFHCLGPFPYKNALKKRTQPTFSRFDL